MQGGWYKAVPSKFVQRTQNHCSRFPVVFSLCASHGERDASLNNTILREGNFKRNACKALLLKYHGPAVAERERSRKNRMGRPKYSNVISKFPVCSFH